MRVHAIMLVGLGRGNWQLFVGPSDEDVYRQVFDWYVEDDGEDDPDVVKGQELIEAGQLDRAVHLVAAGRFEKIYIDSAEMPE
jgi:hypothetical protein